MSGRPEGRSKDLPRIVCLVGPTASGKTALAVELAGALGAEIVSADSRQVYRRLDIGTAKPSAAERRAVPHHCLDLVEPDAPFDAARFEAVATAALADIVRRGRPALVVGGTGLYVRALLGGLCPAPARHPALRRVFARMIAERGAPALHRGLAALDPIAASRIAPADAVRIVRALEVGLTTGQRLSDRQAAHRFTTAPWDAFVIGVARAPEDLAGRIAARAEAMVAAGWLDEVRELRRAGIAADAPGLRAIGYAALLACVEGRADTATALATVVRDTRRFARRQRTWFRAEPGLVWRDPDAEGARIGEEVAAFLATGTRPAAAA
jgi:tRNA dimethylallyltransferase